MRTEQLSILAAAVVAFLAMAAKDDWIPRFIGWVQKTPTVTGGSGGSSPSVAQQQLTPFGITLPPPGAQAVIVPPTQPQGTSSDFNERQATR